MRPIRSAPRLARARLQRVLAIAALLCAAAPAAADTWRGLTVAPKQIAPNMSSLLDPTDFGTPQSASIDIELPPTLRYTRVPSGDLLND